MDRETQYHVPVLGREVCTALCHKKNGTILDATLGGGGHFRMIAKKLTSGATLVGIDRDPDAIAWNRKHPVTTRANVIIEQARFSEIKDVLQKYGINKIDGVIVDLGVSSFQLDSPERGFSFMEDCKLDMRMNPDEGESAGELINRLSVDELTEILSEFGEVRNAPRMARAMKNAKRPLKTSGDLDACLSGEYGGGLRYKVLAKVYMALRIAVNGELRELRLFLKSALSFLADGARIAVIAYHSLEDRIVKEFFREHEPHCVCPRETPACTCGCPGQLKRINRKPIKASVQEVFYNTRARSARLRIAEITTGGGV